MPTAYVTVVVATGLESEICERLRDLDDVADVHVVAGDFDLVVEVDTDSVQAVETLLADHVHPLDGVGHTRTHVVLA